MYFFPIPDYRFAVEHQIGLPVITATLTSITKRPAKKPTRNWTKLPFCKMRNKKGSGKPWQKIVTRIEYDSVFFFPFHSHQQSPCNNNIYQNN